MFDKFGYQAQNSKGEYVGAPSCTRKLAEETAKNHSQKGETFFVVYIDRVEGKRHEHPVCSYTNGTLN